MLTSSFAFAVAVATVAFSQQTPEPERGCKRVGETRSDCCGASGDERSVTVITAKSPYSENTIHVLSKSVGVGVVSAVRRETHDDWPTGEGYDYRIVWIFPEHERPVDVSANKHSQLPGMIRTGKLQARQVEWRLETSRNLRVDVSEEEFLAIKEGLSVRVTNTWIKPEYHFVLDFSCASAWELWAEGISSK